ncbi:MAG: polysaccharide biosynthesis/export family protein [Verrucomicrobiota bacterium]
MASSPPNGGSVDPEAIVVNDTLQIRLDGVPATDRQLNQVTVAQDGSINLPYLNRIKVTDMTTQELARYLEAEYVNRKIFTTPVVTVTHGGRFVYVYGDVAGGGKQPYVSGMTVIQLITAAGGFTEYADERRVKITRDGKVFYFNAKRALENPKFDIPAKPGDLINVGRTPF